MSIRGIKDTAVGQTRDGRILRRTVVTVDGRPVSATTYMTDAIGRVIPPPPPELPTDILWCPECKVESPRSEWAETTVGCEDRGEHHALRCPACAEIHDTIYVTIGAPPTGAAS